MGASGQVECLPLSKSHSCTSFPLKIIICPSHTYDLYMYLSLCSVSNMFLKVPSMSPNRTVSCLRVEKKAYANQRSSGLYSEMSICLQFTATVPDLQSGISIWRKKTILIVVDYLCISTYQIINKYKKFKQMPHIYKPDSALSLQIFSL